MKPEPAKVENDMQDTKPNMATWKTYRSAKLGFQISYPSSYTLTENPSDPNHKGSAISLSNQDAYGKKADKVYGQIFVKKTRTSLKAQNNALFNGVLTSLGKVATIDGKSAFLQYDYFTASASDISRTYVLTDLSPKSPADDGSAVGNVLIATVEASTEGEIAKTTTPDWIARSLQFAK
jgi:hypothetical protein